MGLVFLLASVLVLGYGGVLFVYALTGRPWALRTFFVFYIFLSGASFRTRAISDTSVDWQVALKLAIWGGGLLVGLVNYRSAFRLFRSRIGAWFGLWLLVVVLSVIYSGNLLFSAGGAAFLIGNVLFSAAVVERTALDEFAKLLAITFGFGLLVGIAFFFLKPSVGVKESFSGGDLTNLRLAGVYGANVTGATASLLIGICTSLWYKKKLSFNWFVCGSGLGVACLIASADRGAMAAFFAAIVGTYILARRKVGVVFVSVIVGSIFSLILLDLYNLNINSILAHLTRSGTSEELYTLTGRLSIWVYSMENILRSPFLGYGFGGVRSVLMNAGSVWTATHAHNFVLQNLLSTGLLGSFFLIRLLYLQLKATYVNHINVIDYIFLFIFVYGVTASVISLQPSVVLTLWVLTVFWRSKVDLE